MKYLNKTIEYGLYLLVFLLPIQTRWIIKAGANEYSTYSLYGTDILLILLLLMFVIYNFKFKIFNLKLISNFKFQISNLLILGLILAAASSIFGAADKILSLYKLGWLILGAGLFWLAVSANYNRFKLIYFMLAGVFLQAVLGIWQFLTQSSVANKWLGLAWHKGADLGTSVIEAVGADGVGERWLRAYGGLDHPNMLGGMLAVGILLLIGQMIKFGKIPNPNDQLPIKSQIPMTNYQVNSKFIVILKYINWLLLPVFTAALFFSFSRSAWLGLALGLGAMLVRAVAGKNYKRQKGLAEIILVMGILLFVLFSQYQNLITSRLAVEGRLENKSTAERLVSYQESWQMIKNHWVTGIGLGNYTLALSRPRPGQSSFYYQPAHNVYMLVLSEVGILGFILFLGLIVYLIISKSQFPMTNKMTNDKYQMTNKFLNSKLEIRNCLSWLAQGKLEIGDKNNAKDMIIGLPVLLALLVMMSLDHWPWSLHFGALFFWLVIGLAASSGRDEAGTEKTV